MSEACELCDTTDDRKFQENLTNILEHGVKRGLCGHSPVCIAVGR